MAAVERDRLLVAGELVAVTAPIAVAELAAMGGPGLAIPKSVAIGPSAVAVGVAELVTVAAGLLVARPAVVAVNTSIPGILTATTEQAGAVVTAVLPAVTPMAASAAMATSARGHSHNHGPFERLPFLPRRPEGNVSDS